MLSSLEALHTLTQSNTDPDWAYIELRNTSLDNRAHACLPTSRKDQAFVAKDAAISAHIFQEGMQCYTVKIVVSSLCYGF